MWYRVDLSVDVDVEDAFDNLGNEKKKEFISKRIKLATNESLLSEAKNRHFSLERDKVVEYLTDLIGTPSARDLFADVLGLQHTTSVESICEQLKNNL